MGQQPSALCEGAWTRKICRNQLVRGCDGSLQGPSRCPAAAGRRPRPSCRRRRLPAAPLPASRWWRMVWAPRIPTVPRFLPRQRARRRGRDESAKWWGTTFRMDVELAEYRRRLPELVSLEGFRAGPCFSGLALHCTAPAGICRARSSLVHLLTPPSHRLCTGSWRSSSSSAGCTLRNGPGQTTATRDGAACPTRAPHAISTACCRRSFSRQTCARLVQLAEVAQRLQLWRRVPLTCSRLMSAASSTDNTGNL